MHLQVYGDISKTSGGISIHHAIPLLLKSSKEWQTTYKTETVIKKCKVIPQECLKKSWKESTSRHFLTNYYLTNLSQGFMSIVSPTSHGLCPNSRQVSQRINNNTFNAVKLIQIACRKMV